MANGTRVSSLWALEALADKLEPTGFSRASGDVKIESLPEYENNRLNDIAAALRRKGNQDGGAHAFFFNRAKAVIIAEPVPGAAQPSSSNLDDARRLGERDQELLLSLHRSATAQGGPRDGTNEGYSWRVIPVATETLDAIPGRLNDLSYWLRQSAVDSGQPRAALFERGQAVIAARIVDPSAPRPTPEGAEAEQQFLLGLQQQAKAGSGFASGMHQGIEWKLSLL